MKKRIEEMITELKTGSYDNEAVHADYDKLLEDFILNYDPSLIGLMTKLISLEKDFWYA